MFSKRNLQMCTNGLLIIRCEFILVKIEVDEFFSVGKIPVRAQHNVRTYDKNRMKKLHMVKYLGCYLHANLKGE